MRPANWRHDAACLDADPDLFFPVGTTGPPLLQVDQAKRICRGCPVRTPCLVWALDQDMDELRKPMYYEIRVRGQLSETLLGAFPGLRAEA